MSKDYRCKDCEWWKEYGMICTKLYVHAGEGDYYLSTEELDKIPTE